MTRREIAQRTPLQEVLADIRGNTFAVELERALPRNVSVQRFQRVTETAIRQQPDLITVDRKTLFQAVIRCAQDGLLPDGREAALVVFNDKNAAGGKRATYLPMVGGLRKIAAKHGISIEAFVVFSNDRFAYELGFTPSVTHTPPALESPRGEPVGAYAVATDRDGRKYLEVMARDEIEKVRKVSRASDSQYGPWVNWWDQMARKTVARRLFKQLPLGDLEEADTATLDAADAEVDLPAWEQTADVEEANLHAAVSAQIGGTIPDDDGPDDAALEGEVVEDTQFQIPESAR